MLMNGQFIYTISVLAVGMFFFMSINGIFAWRVSYMLVHEEGPLGIFSKLRNLFLIPQTMDLTSYFTSSSGTTEKVTVGYTKVPFLWDLFMCVYCMSVWMSVPGTLFIWALTDIMFPESVVGMLFSPFFLLGSSGIASITHRGFDTLEELAGRNE